MLSIIRSFLVAACVSLVAGAAGHAADREGRGPDRQLKPSSGHFQHGQPERSFNRIGSLANYVANASRTATTVSEIVASTREGNLLVYTDSPLQQVGFVDIEAPNNPIPLGKVDVGGEPTSVDILGNSYALVAVDTSPSFAAPDGKLVVIDLASRSIVAEHALGGQPDSIKISPDGRYAAIAIENERDEDVEVDGVEGGIPQLPGGFLAVMDLVGGPTSWTRRDVTLTGLAAVAPQDPEPEFVDVNRRNEAVVTLQENNHLVIVDLPSGRILRHFPMGSVELHDVDVEEDELITLTESLAGVPREADAVTWLDVGPSDALAFATANEGDLDGGSRGFTIFGRLGGVLFDSGNSLEHLAVQHGHYPESRSDAKGTEPEAVEFARFGDQDYLFVASERGGFVAVYELDGVTPRFSQLLAAPFGPEGLRAIPSRNLLVASGEEDVPEFGVRSTLMVYELGRGKPDYPHILSAEENGAPIPWSALSGMVEEPGTHAGLLAVSDSYYADGYVYRIDSSERPALVTHRMAVKGASARLDLEGVAVAPDGTLWVASEGNATDTIPNRLLQLDDAGNVLREIGLPPQILACRRASTSRGTLGSGFEGLAVQRLPRGYRILVAQQRGWDYTTPDCEALDDDSAGFSIPGEPKLTRIWVFDPASDAWNHVSYELAPKPANALWVGLSEISAAPGGGFIILERDNRTGDFAELKTLVKVRTLAALDGHIAAYEKSVYDMLPALQANNGWITDKPEGVAVTRDGRVFVVTDNDGVEDWSGETWFLELGRQQRLFR